VRLKNRRHSGYDCRRGHSEVKPFSENKTKKQHRRKRLYIKGNCFWIFDRLKKNAMPPPQGWGKRAGDPRHVANFMDGNGRWAVERGLKRFQGHEQGAKIVETRCTALRRLRHRIFNTLFVQYAELETAEGSSRIFLMYLYAAYWKGFARA
jgi:hypothetical protein